MPPDTCTGYLYLHLAVCSLQVLQAQSLWQPDLRQALLVAHYLCYDKLPAFCRVGLAYMDYVSNDKILPADTIDYSAVIQRLAAKELSGGGSVWPRASNVRPNQPGYFVPETNLYRDCAKADRRSGKELEYLHSAGTWLEHGLAALELAFECTSGAEQGRRLHLAQEYFESAKEILCTRTYHQHLVLTKGVKTANKLADLVETKEVAKQDRVPSSAYQGVLSELAGKYVLEGAKQLAKDSF